MDANSSNLRNLVEELEQARRFHEVEARLSSASCRQRHQRDCETYSEMLAQIALWQTRHPEEATTQAAQAGDHDDFAHLIDRIYKIHAETVPGELRCKRAPTGKPRTAQPWMAPRAQGIGAGAREGGAGRLRVARRASGSE